MAAIRSFLPAACLVIFRNDQGEKAESQTEFLSREIPSKSACSEHGRLR